MSHSERLLDWFKITPTVTQAQATGRPLKNLRLADTVMKLRQKGHHIDMRLERDTNIHGEPCSWGVYTYLGGPE